MLRNACLESIGNWVRLSYEKEQNITDREIHGGEPYKGWNAPETWPTQPRFFVTIHWCSLVSWTCFCRLEKNRVLPTKNYRDLHLWPFFRWGIRSNHPKENLRVFYRVAFGFIKMRFHQMFLKLFIHSTTSHLLCKDPSQTNAGRVFFSSWMNRRCFTRWNKKWSKFLEANFPTNHKMASVTTERFTFFPPLPRLRGNYGPQTTSQSVRSCCFGPFLDGMKNHGK